MKKCHIPFWTLMHIVYSYFSIIIVQLAVAIISIDLYQYFGLLHKILVRFW